MTLDELDLFVERRRQALKLRGLVSECACCGATYTLQQWLDLDFVGVQRLGGDVTELRDCAGENCRTTLCVPLEEIAGEAL